MDEKELAYWATLTYRPNHREVDREAYSHYQKLKDDTKLKAIQKEYEVIVRKHIKNLFQSIREHGRTAKLKNKEWSFKIKWIASCEDGYGNSLAKQLREIGFTGTIELAKKWEGRGSGLHIHLLITGEKCSWVLDWINGGWFKRHGFVTKGKLASSSDVSRYSDYMDCQAFTGYESEFES